MEKLIMLLDIYEEEVVGVHSVGDKITDKEVARIISKQFGFIKWLVENDKIDTTNRFTLMANVENKENGLGYAHTFEGYEALIMILSIQDNPIEFLISILK